MSSTKLNKILEKLRSEFLNVIDKIYPKDIWDNSHVAHEGKPIPTKKMMLDKTKFEAMC